MAGGANPTTSVLYALAANSAIAVAKGAAAFVTGSGAMLAEAVHSVADAGNQVLLLLGIKQSTRPPSDQHPMGYGKTIYFWSFLVAVILFTIGGMFSIYEGVDKLRHPHALVSPMWAVGVLIFAIIAESISLWGALREINKVRGDRGYFQWFRESRQSALIVVFGEDIAALLGLIFALVAVVATMLTGNPLFDAIGTIMIGILLIVIAIFIAVEVRALLIGQGVEKPERARMLQFLADRPEVGKVFNMITLHMGDDVMVAIKAQMQPADGDLVAGINRVEADFRQAFPYVQWLFFEPDSQD